MPPPAGFIPVVPSLDLNGQQGPKGDQNKEPQDGAEDQIRAAVFTGADTGETKQNEINHEPDAFKSPEDGAVDPAFK